MKRHRIGLLAGNKIVGYPYSLRQGVQNALEEQGHLLVAVADLVAYHALDNAVDYFRVSFEIAKKMDLDGYIVPADVIEQYMALEQKPVKDYIDLLDPRRTLVLDEGYRCIGKDNRPGMHECMKYLIEKCGHRKLGFVSGPEESPSAREREEVFFDEMHAHGLEVAPQQFIRSSFVQGQSEPEIEQLLDSNETLDAIVCGSDQIAICAYEALKRRNLVPGKDIAVTGFDDIPQAGYMEPPLATVHLTGYDLGYAAGYEVIRLCEGKNQETKVLTSYFVPRNSGGIRVEDRQKLFWNMTQTRPFPEEALIDQLMAVTLSPSGRQIREDFRKRLTNFMAGGMKFYERHIFEKDESTNREYMFSFQAIQELFATDYQKYLSLDGFQTAMNDFFHAMRKTVGPEEAAWMLAQSSHFHLRIARLFRNRFRENSYARSRRDWSMTKIMDSALQESDDPQMAMRLMLEEVHKIGFSSAVIYLLPEPLLLNGRGEAELPPLLYLRGKMEQGTIRVFGEGEQPVFFSEILNRIEEGFEDRSSIYMAGGLMASREIIGIALFDGRTMEDNGFTETFQMLGYAMKHIQMIQNEQKLIALLDKDNRSLAKQSRQDEMTGLLNRRGFMAQLETMIASRQGRHACILYLDLDGLKQINDTYGHEAGDDAIRNTAIILKSSFREEDLLARQGGDEFLAFTILQGDAIQGLIQWIRRKMDAFNQMHKREYTLSMSIGAQDFELDSHTMTNLAKLMAAADAKLYDEKRRKKDGRL